VDDAGPDIERALALNPNDSNALSLQTIIAIVQNEKDKALDTAQKAVQANPNSATAQIALSYAQQARFDLEGARASLEKAVQLEPQNALAWARLSELHSSFGELSKTLEAAQKAVALEPNLSRIQTVLGFAYLTQIRTKEAKEAFENAIGLDQADPLPRLGLGLAKIREGALEGGSRDLEIAASLDPNNSLIRSYLGKAYYEEKRTTLDEREYKVAKELDPEDPTPWLYDAIAKQTTNRPVEALRDLETAIKLNDNRAVYRSRLLLDSDLAARSASLARIYSDLGFQQLALVEGWRSVNTDPTNFSAHRFLADSYAVLPRHEIARVSALLQSQLLQPQNMTPIQPRLAESNLFLISAGGPGALSFNEFNPIFNRDGVTVQASGLLGEQDTLGAEGVISGIYRQASFSAGITHFETDGWRTNANQDDDIANVFFQWELAPTTSVQTEYRYRKSTRGETQLRFFADDFRPNVRQEEDSNTVRLGMHHGFSPGSDLIANLTFQTLVDTEKDSPLPIVIDGRSDQEAFGGELSYLFRSKYLNIVTGAGYFSIQGDDTVNVNLLTGLPPPFDTIPLLNLTETRDATHTNLYLYTYFKPMNELTFTVGASGDFFDPKSPQDKQKDQFNPKFGVVWNPLPSTTVRGAVFRTLKRTLITDQTLEPTQVAGFNQFFDDFNSTDAWRYGGAINQNFTENLYGGIEYSERDLEVPFFDAVVTNTIQEVDWKEKQFRGYLYWTPHKWVALSAEWLWERFVRDAAFANGARTVETNYIPLGLAFFHPSGLIASVKGTYVDQQGSFERVNNLGVFEDGRDSFWLLDAAISYRLPRRYGFITLGVTNLLDHQFEYFDTDPDNARIKPARFVYLRLTLALP
jgi:tetratricopeptide (TPR) repeat protein